MKLLRWILCLGVAVFLPILVLNASAAPAATKTAAETSVRPSQRIDINHATVAELVTLPGIQDAYAAKIIKSRPYANKTQLLSKGVISAASYKRIRSLIIAKQ